ncbi:MAG TPA: TetR family transcriptional regulator [Candidatus Acidoferrales bacterium]|nr:TetR family transcriptional regulator [Candidatus Acidoferrales bacterium]
MQANGARARRNGQLTRKEAKELTRRRLLAAARQLVLARGQTEVAASAAARRAGVAGATFYEHFRDRADLLRALADDVFTGIREELRQPRREAIAAPSNEEKLRQQFRRPLEIIAANPALFRLALRVRHQPRSPLGDSSRALAGSLRTDLVDELVERGYPSATAADRRRLEMVADIHIAATEALAVGHLNGRYPDLDELVDMLVLVTRGTRLLREWQGEVRPPVESRPRKRTRKPRPTPG